MLSTDLTQLLRGKALNLSRLAAALGVNKSTASRWSRNKVPADRVNDVARVTGIPREALRPDLYAEQVQ